MSVTHHPDGTTTRDHETPIEAREIRNHIHAHYSLEAWDILESIATTKIEQMDAEYLAKLQKDAADLIEQAKDDIRRDE